MKIVGCALLVAICVHSPAAATRVEQCKIIGDAMVLSATAYANILKSIKFDPPRYTELTPDEDELLRKTSETANAAYEALKKHVAQMQDTAYALQKCARQ